ncbi:SIR2 family protein [Caulobacter endophyticus]|uniref:SIR2 family protein n=1 Tax=Caulobacter endophyticus TaxID=2172652 RepID=UPI00240EC40B|nr:SIR2 family protein [Caulobacter endophyticus]MDG2531263.1 SIR2 family protein [Caulobacter endophyticus]
MTEALIYLEDDLPGLPEDLMLARDQGRVLFLTGAGVSTPAPSELPDFQGLVCEIAKRLDARLGQAMYDWREEKASPSDPPKAKEAFMEGLDPRQCAEFKRFVSSEYDMVLGMLERRMVRASEPLSSLRVAARQILDAAKAPNALHASINLLARRFGELFVATTNFDRLHEEAARPEKVASHGLEGLPRASNGPGFHGVFHIHGVLDPKQSRQLVLTDQDFGDLYLRRRLTADFIYDATRIFHLVIVGYSVNDPPFRYLMNAVAGDSLHFPDLKDRYVFAPRDAGDLTVGEDWSARSIIPICYDKADHHAELARLLKAWAASIPSPGEDRWARKRLRRLCRGPRGEASEANVALFGYIFRRALRTEQGALARFLGEIGADPGWLDEAIKVLREPRSGS